MRKLKIGVVGVGHLGRFHVQQIKEIDNYEFVGIYDEDKDRLKAISLEFGVKAFNSYESLINAIEIIDIVVPTFAHYRCAKYAIEKGKHVFIEKPLANSLEEAKELVELANKFKVKTQVGHIERFNPAFLAAQKYNLKPVFIETDRIADYNPRGTDVSVVLDLMIHDIDIVLKLVDSEIKYISASGVPIIGDKPDIASARIEFENGFVANLTASRASLKKERKMRLFQKNAYITIDFLKKETNVFKIRETKKTNNDDPFTIVVDTGKGKPKKEITVELPDIEQINAIRYELKLFAISILNNQKSEIPIEEGFKNLELAYKIIEKINSNKIISI